MKEVVTNNGKKGGWLKGKPHYDKNGKPLGGIKAVVTDAGGKPVELEGGEVIINKEASAKHWKELSKINQSAGNGVAIGPPVNSDEDPEEYKNGGKVIEFNANHIPNKWILQYAKKIKENHPEIWKLGGNIFGNEAFKNLKRVAERGYWLDSEKWMYIKWRSYVARHQRDYQIEGVVAMLKWVDKVGKGWPYMKQLIEEQIDKLKGKKEQKGWKHKMKKGGKLNELNIIIKNVSDADKKYILFREEFFTHLISGKLRNIEGFSEKNGNKDINDLAIEISLLNQQHKAYEKGRDIIGKLYLLAKKIDENTGLKTSKGITYNYIIKRDIFSIKELYDKIDEEALPLFNELADGSNTTFDGNNPDIRYAKGGKLNELNIIIKNVSDADKKYLGTYRKIFDILDKSVAFYNPYGTTHEEFKGESFYITITPRPDQHIIDKISKLNNIEIVDKFKSGGELTKGIKTEEEHRQTLEKIAAGELNIDQAIERTAKDHLKEDPKYYTKLLQAENEMAKGGELEKKKNINIGFGFIGEIERITTTKKTGTFFRLFAKKRENNIENSYWILFTVKDGKITIHNNTIRKIDLSLALDDQLLYEKNIQQSDVPEILINYIYNNYQAFNAEKQMADGGQIIFGGTGILKGRPNKRVEILRISEKIVTYKNLDTGKEVGLYKENFIKNFIPDSSQKTVEPKIEPSKNQQVKIGVFITSKDWPADEPGSAWVKITEIKSHSIIGINAVGDRYTTFTTKDEFVERINSGEIKIISLKEAFEKLFKKGDLFKYTQWSGKYQWAVITEITENRMYYYSNTGFSDDVSLEIILDDITSKEVEKVLDYTQEVEWKGLKRNGIFTIDGIQGKSYTLIAVTDVSYIVSAVTKDYNKRNFTIIPKTEIKPSLGKSLWKPVLPEGFSDGMTITLPSDRSFGAVINVDESNQKLEIRRDNGDIFSTDFEIVINDIVNNSVTVKKEKTDTISKPIAEPEIKAPKEKLAVAENPLERFKEWSEFNMISQVTLSEIEIGKSALASFAIALKNASGQSEKSDAKYILDILNNN